MAMKPRTPTFRTPTPVRSVYETFQPKSEMKENEEAYFLHIFLPGFVKERIKINCVAATRTLKVVGERPIVGSKKWSRLDQSYPIPENCEVERLEGKFEHGTLIVTMPKKLTYSPKPQQVVETTTKEKNSASPRTPTKGGSTIPSKSTTVEEDHFRDKKSPSSPSIIKGLNDLKKQKGTQNDTFLAQKPKDTSHTPINDDKGKRALEPFMDPQKGQEKIEPKPKILTVDPTRKIDDEKIRQKTILETVRKQLHEKVDEKEGVLTQKEVQEEDRKMPYESRKVDQKYVDHNMVLEGKEIKTRKESPKGEESSVLPKAAAGKEKKTIIDKAKGNTGKGIKEVAASASQVVKRIREGKLNEQEKPLVANMGAAILVIVGLGAYVTYKFTSSSRT